MKYQTIIDTVAIQIDLTHEEARNNRLTEVLNIFRKENLFIATNNYPTNQHAHFFIREYKVKANQTTVASIRIGSFSIKDTTTNTVITTYYVAIEFAGLVSYNADQDKLSHMMLFRVCSYFNTRHITFKITGLDVAIDLYTKFENVLALCIKKSPKTVYYAANELQWYDTTHYIENIPKNKQSLVVQRAYIYDKTIKEGLPYHLTRFEVALQPKFFSNNRSNTVMKIISAINRYYVMYVPNKKERKQIVEKYDALPTLRQRDIRKLKLDEYRCYPDASEITVFLNQMYAVRES